MKEDTKVNFCFLCCVMSCCLSLLTLMISSLDLADARFENGFLNDKVERLEETVKKQNKTIEDYKKFVDGVAYNITSGNW